MTLSHLCGCGVCQGSSDSVGLAGRNSILSSLDSLLAGRQASAPTLGQPRPAAGAPEQLLASLLSALRQQQQSHRIADGGTGPPAAAPQPAQLPAGGQLGSIARQLSNTSSLQVCGCNHTLQLAVKGSNGS